MTTRKFSPLTPWLERRHPLKPFINMGEAEPNFEYGGFVGLDSVMPIHETIDRSPQSLDVYWKTTRDYLKKALDIASYSHEEDSWLDWEEVEMIKKELGEPPDCCYPLYFISVGSGNDETPVYIGITSSTENRFKNGHSAITKLHRPEYDGLSKQIYFGCVCLMNDDKDLLPLEWIQPKETARELLKSVESQLIHYFKPALNIQAVHSYNAIAPTFLHIQNFITGFLNDVMIHPE